MDSRNLKRCQATALQIALATLGAHENENAPNREGSERVLESIYLVLILGLLLRVRARAAGFGLARVGRRG